MAVAAPSERARQLESLAKALPGANQKVATGLQEARKTQLQSTLQQMTPSQAGMQAAQALGQQQAQVAGAIGTQQAKTAQSQQVQLGQLGLQEKAAQQRQQAFQQQLGLNEKQQEMASKLNKLDSKLKNQLLDQQLEFRRDQAGQALLNDRQLLDWAVTKAQSAEDLKNYAQMTEQMTRRKLQMVEMAWKVINTAAERGYIGNKKIEDRKVADKIRLMKRDAEIAKQRAVADAKNKFAQSNAIMTIAGIAAGAGIAAIPGLNIGAAGIIAAGGLGGQVLPGLGAAFGIGE